MADENIHVKITGAGRPSSIGGGTTPSFASSATDANPRAIIRADKGIVDSQNKLADQIRELRVAMRRTAEGSHERSALTHQISELRALQRANVGAIFSGSTIAKPGAGITQPLNAAQRPTLGLNTVRAIGRSIVGALRETWAGNPVGAIGHVFRGGSSAIGMRAMSGSGAGSAATGAAEGAEGVAAEDAAALGLGSVAGAVGAVAGGTLAGFGTYEAVKHPRGAYGAISAPYALALARRYGGPEASRETSAYRYARSFGESGARLSGFTRRGGFSALGIDPDEALGITGGMRSIAGSRQVSNRDALSAARVGTYLGLSNPEITATGGTAGRLGVDPSKAIDVIAKGVEKGGQQGLQGEVARSTLSYLEAESRRAAVNETSALKNVTGIASILSGSGIAAFRGSGAINAVSNITAANQPGDLFGMQTTGRAFVLEGQASALSVVNKAKRFRSLTGADRIAQADRLLRQGLTGPNADLYLKGVLAPEISTAKAMGPYGMESLEVGLGLPVGASMDRLLKGDLLTAAESANVTDYLKITSRMEGSGKRNIPGFAKATAGHAASRAGTGASALGTYTGIENVEAAALRRAALKPGTDADVALDLNRFADFINPSAASKASKASTPDGSGGPMAHIIADGEHVVHAVEASTLAIVTAINALAKANPPEGSPGVRYAPEPPTPTVTVHGATRSTAATPRATPTH